MTPELLAPAGDEQSAYAALFAGADAVYLGLRRFSARESAANFSEDALLRVTTAAHLLGAKVYVALNTLVKESETEEFFGQAVRAWNCGADAILMQDIFLGKALKEAYPEIVLHLSTQAGCCNVHGAVLAKRCGFSRVVLARETPLSDIPAISEVIETEAFVQGALCTCFSGQCYFSSFAGGNSGNRGRCKQPCRREYSIDRKGFGGKAYALSPSDLCVGDDLSAYLKAGVFSLKIEGRMRRPEYVAAAVKYYRALIAGESGKEEFSRLKRAYNRGDYTRGLAFGQSRFLSRDVQGHIGEEVGTLSFRGGKPFCASTFEARKGDAFKLLREGKEVGGAVFSEPARGGFFLSSHAALRAGDTVRVTTDTAANERSAEPVRFRPVRVFVRVRAGEPLYAEAEGFSLAGETVSAAKNAPLSAEDIAACFSRTDGSPLLPKTEVDTENAFLPRSSLNAFRRAFFEGLIKALAPARDSLPVRPIPAPERVHSACNGSAAIGREPCGDIFIYKPDDYSRPERHKGAFLYLPPLFTAADEALLAPRFHDYAGIYCEGTYGIVLSERYGIPLFAGTGFNLTNSYAVGEVARCAEAFVLSKELSVAEQRALARDGAFALSEGGIKLMDLCYCPFSRSCASCDRRGQYTLTDGEGRKFPLRRYELNGCRFEVYNCARLSAEGGAAPLLDGTVCTADMPVTRGHSQRSML